MSFWRLFLWSSRRDWRQREVRVVLAALIVAVATVSMITLFAAHLRFTLISSATQFLAADRQLDSENGEPIPQAWRYEARSLGLETARMVRFSTMVQGQGRFQLVSVKAVSPEYPLRGEVEVQASADGPRLKLSHGPERGHIWVNPRLLKLLDLQIGDSLTIGQKSFTISYLLQREPDASFRMAALAPRVIFHVDDVPETGVIQPGSRVEYVNLFAGEETALDGFYQWLKPKLGPSHEWESIRDGRTLSESLDRAERYLLLGGSLAVLLAAVAVAVASRQYALRQRDSVALLKTLGMTGAQINRLYRVRLLVWGVVGGIAGVLVSLPGFMGLVVIANRLLDEPAPWHIEVSALWPAFLTALVALFAFAYPPIRQLRGIPAMRVLRSQSQGQGEGVVPMLLIALLAMAGLLWLYAREWWLVAALIGGLLVVLVVLGGLSGLLIGLLKRVQPRGGSWRLALVSLYRHRRSSLAQMAVFSMTVLLAAVLFLVRSSLLADWQAQLPEDAPNHFLINIAPDAVADVRGFLQENDLESTQLYPMVRGRLTELNGQPVKEAVSKDEEVNALNRELNLTWMDKIASDNSLRSGRWWREGEQDAVSIESRLADRLGVTLGDELTFTIGERKKSATVRSIRNVQWDSMRPNFYMAFPPGALDEFPATYITAFYLPRDHKEILNQLGQRFPTVTILEIDHFIERIRQIIAQVTAAIEAILGLILVAAILVMGAVVNATLQERQREGALLRTLGAQRHLLVRSTLMEFAVMGLVSGLLGVAAAELAVWGLQYQLFEGQFYWHWPVWGLLTGASVMLLMVFGRLQLRPVLNVSPMLLLRRLEG
ncbi:ABC transporter ATP-binding protein [Marinobacteraceae bacterium S3BR75-40.1]